MSDPVIAKVQVLGLVILVGVLFLQGARIQARGAADATDRRHLRGGLLIAASLLVALVVRFMWTLQ